MSTAIYQRMQLEFTELLNEIQGKNRTKETQLYLDVETEEPFHFVKTSDKFPQPLFTLGNKCFVAFSNDKGECGKFTWDDGTFRFHGNAEESAKLFANFVGKNMGMNTSYLTK